MKNIIIITELILAFVAVIIFLSLKSYLKKHGNDTVESHSAYIKKMLLALIFDGALIFSVGAIYLVMG